jgi:hypothetical protein
LTSASMMSSTFSPRSTSIIVTFVIGDSWSVL